MKNACRWVEILGVGRDSQNRLVVLFYNYGEVDKTGLLITRARFVSELKNRRLRPIDDNDYGPGGPAEYYKEYMGS